MGKSPGHARVNKIHMTTLEVIITIIAVLFGGYFGTLGLVRAIQAGDRAETDTDHTHGHGHGHH